MKVENFISLKSGQNNGLSNLRVSFVSVNLTTDLIKSYLDLNKPGEDNKKFNFQNKTKENPGESGNR